MLIGQDKKSKGFLDFVASLFGGMYQGANLPSLGDNSGYGSFLLKNESPGFNSNSALYGTPDNATLLAGSENAITGNLDYQRVLDQLYKEQAFNRDEAQKNRDFQLMMSNTAYQRQMNDLQAAGINPALVLGQGGASAASGSVANSTGKNVHSTSSQLLSTLVGGLMNITNSALKANVIDQKTEQIEAKANAADNSKNYYASGFQKKGYEPFKSFDQKREEKRQDFLNRFDEVYKRIKP